MRQNRASTFRILYSIHRLSIENSVDPIPKVARDTVVVIRIDKERRGGSGKGGTRGSREWIVRK